MGEEVDDGLRSDADGDPDDFDPVPGVWVPAGDAMISRCALQESVAGPGGSAPRRRKTLSTRRAVAAADRSAGGR